MSQNQKDLPENQAFLAPDQTQEKKILTMAEQAQEARMRDAQTHDDLERAAKAQDQRDRDAQTRDEQQRADREREERLSEKNTSRRAPSLPPKGPLLPEPVREEIKADNLTMLKAEFKSAPMRQKLMSSATLVASARAYKVSTPGKNNLKSLAYLPKSRQASKSKQLEKN